jgi:hypothetical protein
MFGIICKDSIDVVGHSLFNNFRLGLENYLSIKFKDVNNINDLNEIQTLFIIDEHFDPHVKIWKKNSFINYTNEKKIRVIVFNFEKIFSSSFPWNVDHQKQVERFTNLFQIVSDINDSKILKTSFINKQLLSKNTTLIPTKINKKEAILFLGQVNSFYPSRKQILESIQKTELPLPVEIIVSDRKLTYMQFLENINSYKYILNPLGTGTFLNLRFYEALKLQCIPVQQITEEMSKNYDELIYAITFKDVNDIPTRFITPSFQMFNYYLEDYFSFVNLKSFI